MNMHDEDKSLDLIGLGKLAKSIPDSVYLQTTETVCRTFESLIAPITATTWEQSLFVPTIFS
jgi:hypothetical protein